jgi:hypothetical protein
MKKPYFKPLSIKKFFFLFIPVFFMCCSANQKIAYKTDNIPALSNSIPITVSIKEFSDERKNNSENLLLFENGRQTKHDKKTVCINSEKHYKKETVTLQISRQIAEHFDKIKLFRQTTFADNSQTDYYLTGSLSYFYGVQNFSTSAAVGSHFGLIGALATSGAKTPAEITIEVKDIALYDKNGNLVQDFGTYRKDYSEELHADAYCWCIYGNINQKLHDFTNGLAEKIKTEFRDIDK